MNRFKLTVALVALIAGSAASGMRVAHAQSQSLADPLTINFTLVTDPVVMAGDAIIIHYTVADPDMKPIHTKFDPDGDHWYKLILTDENGNPVEPIPNRRHFERRGVFAIHSPFFESGVLWKEDIVVSELFDVTQPGSYKLTIHIDLPYVDLRKGSDYLNNTNLPVPANKTAIKRDVVIPITVTLADDTKLRSEAESLRVRIMDRSDLTQKPLLLERLAAMRDTYAAPSWRALALDPDLRNPIKVAEALAETRSLAAVDILIDMQLTRPPTDFGQGSMTPLLYVKRIYDVSTPEKKAEIDKLLEKHHTNLNIPDFTD